MYLSRIEIDIKLQQTLRALANVEILHGMVENCFEGERHRDLWRMDELNGSTYLLLLSQEKPDLSSLASQIGRVGTALETKDYQPLLDRIQAGSCWNFRLSANPVMSVPCPGKDRGRIKAITIAAHQRDWLVRQGRRHGFSLIPGQFDVVRSEWRIFRSKGNTLSILNATYEGLLRVTEVTVFRKALTEGIGRGKAYGMGLLTVMSHG